jgi:hypothetical protein
MLNRIRSLLSLRPTRRDLSSGFVPDARRRVDGTTYVAAAVEGGEPLGDLPPSLAERLAARLLDLRGGLAVRLVAPKEGDVLVVVGGDVPPALRAEVCRSTAARSVVSVFLPAGCVVHAEPSRLASEDRGYRETKSYGKDVHVGVPGAPSAEASKRDDHGRAESAG